MKHLKVFSTISDYNNAQLSYPAVSYIEENDKVMYDGEAPFNGKWKATYSNGNVTSAECDSSSAITQNEIAKSNLVSVEIGNCVTSIGNSAFLYCSGMTSCTIGNGVTSIGGSAFNSCSGLTSIDIPDSVTTIGNSAFHNCTSLTSITVEAITPPTLGSYAFGFKSKTPIIYVPAESLENYKNSSGWSQYPSRLQPIP